MLPPFKIFAGTNSRYMAEEICQELGVELGKMNIQHFADGEFEVSFEESIRGCEVYLVVSTFPPTDNLMELLLMIDAAKRASAKSIIAVIPYFGWARQDRKDKPRVSIAAKLVVDLLSAAGVDRVITMDLHADQIQGFFNVPVDHLYASSVFIPYIQSLNLEDMVIATPDVGGAKRANSYAKYFNVPLVLCHKQRAKANVVATMTVIGDVKDKNVILVDDMVDTAGSICNAAKAIIEVGGANSVHACASHAVLSGPALERLEASNIEELALLNTIPESMGEGCSKIKYLSVAPMFAEAIERIYQEISIAKLFN